MGNNSGAGHAPQGTDEAPDGYENLVRLDQGGFAIVYQALDIRFDRTVALKVLRSDSLNDRQLRRFNAECLATGRVSSHPNIVTVYDAGITRGHRPWLAMEYCSGGSLAHRLATEGPLPVAEVLSVGARLCGALNAAHQAGILHRDVKPHNVLLTSYGEPALADFGIASVVIADDTVNETAAYTVVHAAPEILEGKAGTAAADIYSLGSTLYTLLAGRAPFAKEASTGLAPLVTRILSNDLPVIERAGVPPELEELLRHAMTADPQDRPATAAELGARLAELGNQLGLPLGQRLGVPQGQRLGAEQIAARTGSLPRSTAIPPAPVTGIPITGASSTGASATDGKIDEQALQVTRRRNITRGSEPQAHPSGPEPVEPQQVASPPPPAPPAPPAPVVHSEPPAPIAPAPAIEPVAPSDPLARKARDPVPTPVASSAPPTPVASPAPPTPVASPAPPAPVASPAPPAPVASPIGARRLLLILGGTLGVLLAVFTAWGISNRGSGPDRITPTAADAKAARAADKYAPKGVVVVQGKGRGELVVTWGMPIRPDVVATVIYEGPGAAKARAIVNYATSPKAVPQATIRGLPSGRQICLSTAHLVSRDDKVTNAVSRPVCAVPR